MTAYPSYADMRSSVCLICFGLPRGDFHILYAIGLTDTLESLAAIILLRLNSPFNAISS